jgi:hypothetical protein
MPGATDSFFVIHITNTTPGELGSEFLLKIVGFVDDFVAVLAS